MSYTLKSISAQQQKTADPMTTITGHLVSGFGRAADLTQIDWVRRQLIEHTGIAPYPGTLNLTMSDEDNLLRWQRWQELPGHTIEPGETGFCRVRCYPVRINGRIPGAVLLPEISDYPANKVELVAAIPLRKHFSLDENAPVKVELSRPLATRAVIFDIDGTLIDSIAAYLEVAQNAAEAFGIVVTKEHVRRALAAGSNFWQGVVPQDRVDGEAVRKAMTKHATREWPRILKAYAQVFDGLTQTLDELKDLGIRLGIVSGARAEVLELLRDADLLDRFEVVILGSDVTKAKPDPEGLIKCLRQLEISAAEAIYVGDAPIDIQASHAAGMRSIGVLTGVGDSAMLSVHHPDRVVSSHTKLTAMLKPH